MRTQQGYWNLTFVHSSEELEAAYETLTSKIGALAAAGGLAGAVVTQLADVETEVSGFLTYDREVMKMNLEKVREANHAIFQAAEATGEK